jgi:hypothetical protein
MWLERPPSYKAHCRSAFLIIAALILALAGWRAEPARAQSVVLTAQYRVGDPSTPNDVQLKPILQVVNGGGASVNLADVKLRYYFTRDTAQSLVFNCDYAAVGCVNVTGSFSPVSPAVTGADYYLEVGFTSGSVVAGANSGEVQARVNKSDFSNFAEGDDYSYNSTLTSFTNHPYVTVYYQGTLVYGNEPAAAATSTPTATNTATSTLTSTATPTATGTATATATTVPTATNTPQIVTVTSTPTPTPSGDDLVRLREATEATNVFVLLFGTLSVIILGLIFLRIRV